MQYIIIGNKYEGFYDIGIEGDEDGDFTIKDIPEYIPYHENTIERMVIDQLEAMKEMDSDPDYEDWADKYADEVLSFQESLWNRIE